MAKYGKTDVFPRSPTRKVKALIDYPKWGSLVGQRDVKYFCLYMDVGDRIYYQKRTPTDTVIDTVYAHGKATKVLNQFRPDVINFAKIYNRYKMPPIETNRVNSDTRTGFKMGSDYLVKAYFTFGQRFVEPGYSHIIQTLNIPILFYLRPRECGDRVKNGLFPTRHLFKYDRRILEPHTRYRVPSGSVYVLFCVQKTFFRLDLADATTEIPFECKDPVMERVVRIKDLYDEPVATPYIEDQNQESTAATYLSFTFPSSPAEAAVSSEFPFASPATISSFLESYNQEPEQQPQPFSEQQQQSLPVFEQQSVPSSEQQQTAFEQHIPFSEHRQQQSQSAFEQQSMLFSQQQQSAPPTYILIQNSQPEAVRKTTIVRIHAKEFVSTYCRLAFREFKNPNEKFCVDPSWNPLPLDLTVKVPLIDLTEVQDDGRETEDELPLPIDLSAKKIDAVQLPMDQQINFNGVEQPMDQSVSSKHMDIDAVVIQPMNESVSQILEELEAIIQNG